MVGGPPGAPVIVPCSREGFFVFSSQPCVVKIANTKGLRCRHKTIFFLLLGTLSSLLCCGSSTKESVPNAAFNATSWIIYYR